MKGFPRGEELHLLLAGSDAVRCIPLDAKIKERPKQEEKQSPLAYIPLMGNLGTKPKVQGRAESPEKSSRKREPGRPAGALAPRTGGVSAGALSRESTEVGTKSRGLAAKDTAGGFTKARMGRQLSQERNDVGIIGEKQGAGA
jgi:hypothetical protein